MHVWSMYLESQRTLQACHYAKALHVSALRMLALGQGRLVREKVQSTGSLVLGTVVGYPRSRTTLPYSHVSTLEVQHSYRALW